MVLLGVHGQVGAGMPYPRAVLCTLDGALFEVTDTQSCTVSGARSLSLAPVTTCPFVTDLPLCPGSASPVYREFSPRERPRLRRIAESAAYRALSSRSPYLRAFHVAGEMEDAASLRAMLLVRGLWHDEAAAFADPGYLAATRAAIAMALPDLEGGDMLAALSAFLRLRRGDAPRAHAELARMAPRAAAGRALAAYLSVIENCLAAPDRPCCHPSAPIPAY